jgi:hypothetical protein
VRVHSLTLSYILGSMKCDSRASLLAHTFVSPCLGREPKVRVMTLTMEILNLEVHATIKALPIHKVRSQWNTNNNIWNAFEGDWNRCDKIPIKNI